MTHFPRHSILAAFAAALACFTGCESTPLPVATQGIPGPVSAELDALPEQPLDPALLSPPESLFRLGPGDTLQIEVMGDLATEATATVGPDGMIYYYILPGVDVWGLTLSQARDRLGQELQKFIREKPVVALTLLTVSSQRIWLLGRLNSPGVYALEGPTSLLDAVAGAGGLEVNTPAGGEYSENRGPVPKLPHSRRPPDPRRFSEASAWRRLVPKRLSPARRLHLCAFAEQFPGSRPGRCSPAEIGADVGIAHRG